MRLFVIFIVFGCGIGYATNSYSQTTVLSLNLENKTVKEVFAEIEKNSEYIFFYYDGILDLERKVTIHMENQKIDVILDELFGNTNNYHIISDRQITIARKQEAILPPSAGEVQQEITITGKVTDNTGLPMPGVTILIKGTTRGVASDGEGQFSISVPDKNAILVFSYIGYTGLEQTVGNRTVMNITLQEAIAEFEEVVVVGYGTQKKVNLTGAISQITAKEMKDRPITRMTQGLQGVIPNLNIVFGSGQPGTSGTINIRGTTSINGGEPLVLVDGVPGNMDRINVNDVESVTVLKDASASAIYGARAAFGVILITTKNATEGTFRVHYQNNFGWTTHATNTDFITSGYWNAKLNDDAMYNALGNTQTRYSSEDYEELWARVNDKTENPARPWVVVKKNASGQDMYRYYANFDWFNYLHAQYRPKQSHDLSITGASGQIKYLVSGNFSDEKGIFKIRPDDNKRYNLRAKIDSDINKWLSISNNTRYFRSTYDWCGRSTLYSIVTASESTSIDHPYYYAYPAYVPINPDGTLTGYTGVNSSSIALGLHAIQENGKQKGQNNDSEFVTTFQAVLKPVKGLTITGNYTFAQEVFQQYFRAVRIQYSKFPGVMETYALADLNQDRLTESMRNDIYHVGNIFSNYEASLGNHSIKAMAGFNQELKTFKTLSGSGQELLSESLNDLNLLTGEQLISGGASEWALRGVFYRLNYDYAGKYLFETSGRYDGTSRFPQKSRFGFFPSFSVGYRISEESFFEPLKSVVNNLKVRYSYGTLGNQDVSTYAYISTMSTGTNSYLVNNQRLRITNNPAPVASTLTWEKSITNNVGLDAVVMNGRLSLTTDFYTRDTKDMLTLGKKLPSVFGASEPRENAADLRTKGFEVSLGWQDRFNVANKPFRYGVTTVLSDATSKITKFDNPSGLLSSYREGQQLGEIWGYRFDGFFKTTEEAQAYAQKVNQDRLQHRRASAPTADLRMLQAGDIKILDLDGNGVINSGSSTVNDPGDREIIGNSTPRYSYGISAFAGWNGIDFFILFQGIGKQDWYPHGESQQFWQVYSRPYSSFIPTGFQDKMWSPENPNARFPRVIGYMAQNAELAKANDMYLQDVAYCKLRNLTIGYTMPSSLVNKIGIEHLRIYLSGENLFTLTKLETDYIDPEETMFDSTAKTYPMGKTFSLGIEISF